MKNKGRPSKMPGLTQKIIEVLTINKIPMSITMIKEAVEKEKFRTSRASVWRAVTNLAAANRIKSETVTRSKNKKVFRVFRSV